MPEYSVDDGLIVSASGRRILGTLGPLLLFAAAFEGSACAMQPADQKTVNCSVENQGKLPPELRNAEAVCGPIGRAARDAAARVGFKADAVTVRVKVNTAYKMTATAVVNGTELPEQNLGSSDRPLTAASIEMLADAVGAQVAEFGAKRR